MQCTGRVLAWHTGSSGFSALTTQTRCRDDICNPNIWKGEAGKLLGFCDLHNWWCPLFGALFYFEKNLLLELPTAPLLLFMVSFSWLHLYLFYPADREVEGRLWGTGNRN